MSLVTAWIALPLLLGLLSLGCGLLAHVAADSIHGPLVVPTGFALLIVVSSLATMSSATATLAAPLVVGCAVVGLGLTAPWRRYRPNVWAAVAAVAVFAVYAARIDPEDPLFALESGEQPDPSPAAGWTTVTVRAAALNHHDVWSLRGVGLREEQLPMILGCDAAGIDEAGNEVIVHAVISDDAWRGDETLDPRRSLLSERHPGTFAEKVAVPRRNIVPKPAELSFPEAACLPTAWLTAYRMLFTRARVAPGSTVLVQGAGGGVATALIVLARAAGVGVWAASRSEEKRERARALGADQVFEPGVRLPERVDAAMETVGAATWAHSVRALKPGGTLVICGATSGADPPAELTRIFFLQLSVLGSTMGTRDELERLARFRVEQDVRPEIDTALPLREARAGIEAIIEGDVFGKIVLEP